MGVQNTTTATVAVAGAAAMAVGLYFITKSKQNGMLIPFVPATDTGKSDSKKKQEQAKPSGPTVKILYGSQTGTAQDFAKSVAEEGRKLNLNMQIVDLEVFEPGSFAGSNCLFLVATYGEGEPTDNAKAFSDWLEKEATTENFAGTRYAVFGLGNTQYEHYNSFGKFVDVKLAELGASRFMTLGLGDDDKNLRGDFDDWSEKLWQTLSDQLGVEQSSEAWLKEGVQYHLTMKTYSSEAEAKATKQLKTSNNLEHHTIFEMPVKCNRELYEEGDRSCRHVELELGTANYETGDHVAIFAENDPYQVRLLAKCVGTELDTWISLQDEEGLGPFPCPCTLQDALSKYLDINGIPKKSLLAAMAELAEDSGQQDRLRQLAHKDNHEEYHKYIVQAARTVTDLLLEFSSVKMPVANLLELLPRLQPRYYSISSSAMTNPQDCHVTAVVVEKKVAVERLFKGVCTSYLKQLQNGAKVSVILRNRTPGGTCGVDASLLQVRGYIRRTTFKLPTDSSVPVIMVGAGTGLAPLRGMCMELDLKRRNGEKMGNNLLFFGCRRRGEDYMYESELTSWAKNGTLGKLFLAFSRDPDSLSGKVYVQNKIDEQASLVLSLLDEGAYFYICGSTAMARDVRKALLASLAFLRRMPGHKAEEYLEKLHKEGRFHQDVWSV